MVKKRLFTGRFLLVNLREQLIKPLLRFFHLQRLFFATNPIFAGLFY